MIKGVKFASIPVSQSGSRSRFLHRKARLSFAHRPALQRGAALDRAGHPGADTRVVLFQIRRKLKPGSQMNITFWADNVEATARELKSKGVQFVMEPKREDWGTAAAFQDVDGNTFVLSSK